MGNSKSVFNFLTILILTLGIFSCKKQDLYSEIDLIKQEVSELRKIILDLTQQLQIADVLTRNQIKITNFQIDSIDNKLLPLSAT